MKFLLRLKEYQVLVYRIALVYVFYMIARLLFCAYNADVLQLSSFAYVTKLCYYGLAFDTSAILYVNLLFIIFSLLPFRAIVSSKFQQGLFYIYFLLNLLAYATNFIDFIYYPYSFSRLSFASWNVLQNETNKLTLLGHFLVDYWHVFVLFFSLAFAWIFLYQKVRLTAYVPQNKKRYWIESILVFLGIGVLVVAGIRGGDLKKSTRPINLLDANKHVINHTHADVVLNTPFSILRTLSSNHFHRVGFSEISDSVIAQKVQPVKQYNNNPPTKPNIVVFILESFGREYVGAMNKNSHIKNYKSHTPFIDSLAQYSLIFPNAYANGRQSIHCMSSVFAGIPTYKDAFTSSPYPNQNIESLVSTLKSKGYNTSFFHGAANGSMGFLGFSNVLGIDNYYGRTEYNNDHDFDGVWGIWDEPFLQFMKRRLDEKKQPFLSSVFTVSSHDPFNIPTAYKNKFKEGELPIHKCVEYTDNALRLFFKEAEKSPWYNNTIFVMVADHTNQNFYPPYHQVINRFAVPILFFTPNQKYLGSKPDLAQQIDIYPTLLDMIGYDKPFRSWGRSLIDTSKKTLPFVVHSTGNIHYYSKGDYTCAFDGKKAIGFYRIADKDLTQNLIRVRNAQMDTLEIETKAFYQDYMNRIMNKKLGISSAF